MTERESLLAAICASPEDDTPRLVFADWLDEHEPDAQPRRRKGGAPSSWAALIRAECEFERLRSDGSAEAAVFEYLTKCDPLALAAVRWERTSPGVGQRRELLRAAEQFRPRARKAVWRNLPKKDKGARWFESTHRGFPGGVWLNNHRSVAAFLRAVEACPPVFVSFSLAEESPKEVAASGILRGCRAILVDECQIELVRALGLERDAARVRALYCEDDEGAETSGAVAEAVAAAPNWSGLRELYFGGESALSAAQAERVFAAKHLHHLVRLDVWGYNWTAETLAELNHFTELRELKLSRTGLDDRAALRLAQMPGLANLRRLEVSRSRITGAGASALLTSPHLKNLVVLELGLNPIRGLDRGVLQRAPAGELRVLDLRHCRLTCQDATGLASSPRTRELISFSIGFNGLPESAVARLVKGFGTRAPAVLHLEGNNISTVGAQALASWPASAQIDVLELLGNRLSLPGARALATSPHLQNLNRLRALVARADARAVLEKQFGDRAEIYG
jgi:uncharacterized protein (TIGR02996 family)